MAAKLQHWSGMHWLVWVSFFHHCWSRSSIKISWGTRLGQMDIHIMKHVETNYIYHICWCFGAIFWKWRHAPIHLFMLVYQQSGWLVILFGVLGRFQNHPMAPRVGQHWTSCFSSSCSCRWPSHELPFRYLNKEISKSLDWKSGNPYVIAEIFWRHMRNMITRSPGSKLCSKMFAPFSVPEWIPAWCVLDASLRWTMKRFWVLQHLATFLPWNCFECIHQCCNSWNMLNMFD